MDDPIPAASIPPGPKPPSIPLRPPQSIKPEPPKQDNPPAIASDKTVLIRTMKDDLQEIKSGHKVIPTALPVPKVGQSKTAAMPKEANGKSIVIPPGITKKSSNHTGLTIGLIVLVFLLAVGGTGFWFYYHNSAPVAPAPTAAQPPKDINAMIPSSAASVVQYRANNQNLSNNINQFWALQRSNQPTMESALEGDPRFLLTNQGVQNIYYVVLPDDPSPYLIFAHNDSTAPLVAQIDKTNLLDTNGWYITHNSPLTAYTQALAKGTFENTDTLTAKTDSPYALYVYGNQDAFAQAVSALANKKLVSSAKKIAIWTDLSSTNGQIIFHGALTSDVQLSQAKIDSTILNNIPTTSTYLWVGSNLATDIQQNSSNANVLDQTLLAQPSVSQFLAQLNKPYVYYQEPQTSGVLDIGIVTTLPQTNPPLAIGDKGIESALPAILPLLVGQKEGVPLTFSDATYNNVNLRYVNIPGSTQALDYAIANNNLLIATSKNAMLELIDTVQSKKPNILLSGDISNAAQNIVSNNESAGSSAGLVNGSAPFIPGLTIQGKSSFSIAFQALDAATISISGSFNQTAPAAPSITAQPTNLP